MSIPEVFDLKKKRQARKRRWRITGMIITSIVLTCIVGKYVLEHSPQEGFIDIYDAVRVRNASIEDVKHIVFGDTTATVIHQNSRGNRIEYYYQENDLWFHTNVGIQLMNIDTGCIDIAKTKRGSEWCVRIIIDPRQSKTQEDNIYDMSNTVFLLYDSSELSRGYFAYIYPESEYYNITINEESYSIKLKHFNQR